MPCQERHKVILIKHDYCRSFVIASFGSRCAVPQRTLFRVLFLFKINTSFLFKDRLILFFIHCLCCMCPIFLSCESIRKNFYSSELFLKGPQCENLCPKQEIDKGTNCIQGRKGVSQFQSHFRHQPRRELNGIS